MAAAEAGLMLALALAATQARAVHIGTASANGASVTAHRPRATAEHGQPFPAVGEFDNSQPGQHLRCTSAQASVQACSETSAPQP